MTHKELKPGTITGNKECTRCKSRGKTWEGSDPNCAFKYRVFTPDNWNCATANGLREICERIGISAWNFRDDMNSASFGVIHIPEETNFSGYVVMSWYKSRGKTGQIFVMNDDDVPRPITLKEAESVLKFYETKE